jgi:signal peptidase I
MNPSVGAASNTINALKCELASEVLHSSGKLRLQVVGRSMLPTLWPGDTVLVEPVSRERVSAGEIVMFRRGDRFVAHRVVVAAGEGKSGMITQGDGLPAPDPPVSASEFVGKVMLIERSGRCIDPSTSLGFSGRTLAAIFRRSGSAARIVVGVHGMRPRIGHY